MQGVCDFVTMPEKELDALMLSLPVSKVWGVGSRLEKRLNALGVDNVLRLKRADPKRVRDKFGVVLERTVRELNGESWLSLEEMLPQAKQVMSSRSFGYRLSTYTELAEPISFHASNATQRMRTKSLYANAVLVFIQNSPHDEAEYYAPSLVIPLPAPTDNMMQITDAALWALKNIYRKNVYYLKGGVMLLDLVPAGSQQTDLFGYSRQDEKSNNLMETIDRINSKYSRGTIKLASEGIDKSWAMRRELKSPDYTGSWNDIPIAYT